MNTKHTPGPWHVDVHSNVMSAGGLVAFPGISAGFDQQANARLIAAAPELYDAADNALNTLIGCCVSAGGVDDRKTILEAQRMLRAAIAKATGESA